MPRHFRLLQAVLSRIPGLYVQARILSITMSQTHVRLRFCREHTHLANVSNSRESSLTCCQTSCIRMGHGSSLSSLPPHPIKTSFCFFALQISSMSHPWPSKGTSNRDTRDQDLWWHHKKSVSSHRLSALLYLYHSVALGYTDLLMGHKT